MSSPGWYPDPGGAPGRFRWWDGQTWSATTTADARSVPPGSSGSSAPPGSAGAHVQSIAGPARPARRVWPWVLGLVGLVLVIAVVGWLVVRPLLVPAGGGGTDPGGTSTREVCPPQDSASATLPPQPADGRVHGGPLSYPQLGNPWSAPVPQGRIPFGREVAAQVIQTEDQPPWLAGVFVGRLMAGDGFFSPQEGASIVVRCIAGTFYGTGAVGREDQRSAATTVDGHDAWLIETHFTFDEAGVDAKGEWVMVVVIDAGDGSAGLFWASVPDNAAQYVAPARKAYSGLTVTS